MLKKITILLISLLLLVGCSSSNINEMSLKEIIDDSIVANGQKANTNNKGYRYYLPSEFSISKDNDYIQELLSHNTIYYLNVDAVSYYYKNEIKSIHEFDDYEYYDFSNGDKTGYLRITKNNKDFFVELCYNYAIIEVEVEESELRYAISRGMSILNSIQYNDLVIEKYIVNNDLESGETVYTIPEPKVKNNKNVLEYADEFEDTQEEEDTANNL